MAAAGPGNGNVFGIDHGGGKLRREADDSRDSRPGEAKMLEVRKPQAFACEIVRQVTRYP